MTRVSCKVWHTSAQQEARTLSWRHAPCCLNLSPVIQLWTCCRFFNLYIYMYLWPFWIHSVIYLAYTANIADWCHFHFLFKMPHEAVSWLSQLSLLMHMHDIVHMYIRTYYHIKCLPFSPPPTLMHWATHGRHCDMNAHCGFLTRQACGNLQVTCDMYRM